MLSSPSRSTSFRIPLSLLTLFALLALAACKPEQDPRKDFKDAAERFSRLERASPERCFLDPRMGQVEEILKKVPAESRDYQTAQGMLKRIATQRTRLQAEKTAAESIKSGDPVPPSSEAGTAADAGVGEGGKSGDEDVALAGLDAPDPKVVKAKAFFARYVRLESAYDSILPELYAPRLRAHVATSRRVEELDYARFRKLLLATLGVARRVADHVEYANVEYLPQADSVRITATRTSQASGTGPLKLVVAPDASGQWLIRQAEMTLRTDGHHR